MLFKSGCQLGSKEIQEKSDLVRLALTLEEAAQDESYFLIQRVVGEKGPCTCTPHMQFFIQQNLCNWMQSNSFNNQLGRAAIHCHNVTWAKCYWHQISSVSLEWILLFEHVDSWVQAVHQSPKDSKGTEGPESTAPHSHASLNQRLLLKVQIY